MMISFEVSENNSLWLGQIKEQFGITLDDLLNTIVENYRINNPLKEETKSPEKNLSERIVNFFKKCYNDKFNIPTDEAIAPSVASSLVNQIGDEELAESILQKAIYWYINFNDYVGQGNVKYPYTAKLFFGQKWLWRKCVEATQDVTLDILMKMKTSNMDKKDILKATKRGDGGSFDYNDISMQLDEALELAETLRIKYNIDEEFLNQPKIKELYLSNAPSASYIKQALNILKKAQDFFINEK